MKDDILLSIYSNLHYKSKSNTGMAFRKIINDAVERRVASQHDVQKQLLKHLRMGHQFSVLDMDTEFIGCAMFLRTEKSIRTHSSIERGLFWHSMYAFRRDWCFFAERTHASREPAVACPIWSSTLGNSITTFLPTPSLIHDYFQSLLRRRRSGK